MLPLMLPRGRVREVRDGRDCHEVRRGLLSCLHYEAVVVNAQDARVMGLSENILKNKRKSFLDRCLWNFNNSISRLAINCDHRFVNSNGFSKRLLALLILTENLLPWWRHKYPLVVAE